MTNEEALHRCVTEFMLDSCRSYRLDNHLLRACMVRCGFEPFSSTGKCEVFVSGSSAELFITPTLSCVGDSDIMLCPTNCLAIPSGYTLPAKLPTQLGLCGIVTVFEIVGSHQPGYVYLKPSYLLKRDDNGRVTMKMEKSKDAPQFWSSTDIRDFVAALNIDQRRLSQYYCSMFSEHITLGNPLVQVAVVPHGPTTEVAARTDVMGEIKLTSIDYVFCWRCLVWPPQAADWPTRLRSYGVPDERTIDEVVNNGCDLVTAVHPRCRQDEWMSKYQWRLSFSRAEVTLLNNWTPVQQIIYHMLRFVLKRELFSKTSGRDPDLPKLSNYQIKTLMLWECEQKPQSWWSKEPSLVKICSSLLHKLSDWVANQHCQQYFISNCNLLDHFSDEASVQVCYSLRYLADPLYLVKWFVENYVCKCVPDKVSALFADATSSNELQRATNAVMNTLPRELCNKRMRCEIEMLKMLDMHSLVFTKAVKSLIRPKRLQKVDQSRLYDFCTAAVSLHVAYAIPISSLSEDLLELLPVFCDPAAASDRVTRSSAAEGLLFISEAIKLLAKISGVRNNALGFLVLIACSAAVSDTVTRSSEAEGLLCISKAIKLATISRVRSNALEMLHNELSKAYLHLSFAYGQESTYSVVHVLLAALYYKSGHYQAATDHCQQVLNECDGEQLGTPRCIGAEYLPRIDDNVDTVLGLILLYQHVQQMAWNSDRMLQLSTVGQSVFTTQLLARYLFTVCSTVLTTEVDIRKEYREQLSQTNSSLLSDILLFKSIETRLGACTGTSVAEDRTSGVANNTLRSMDTTLLVTTLELVALEKLITVRQAMIRELQFPFVNEFEALHAYKCGLFEECLKLCRTNVDVLLRRDYVEIPYWLQFREMLSLLEDELVSVVGVIRLMHPNSFYQLMYTCVLMIRVPTLLLCLIGGCHKHGCNDSLHDTLNLICYVHNEVYSADEFGFDRQILRLIFRSLRLYIENSRL